jgi:hypothetical protein
MELRVWLRQAPVAGAGDAPKLNFEGNTNRPNVLAPRVLHQLDLDSAISKFVAADWINAFLKVFFIDQQEFYAVVNETKVHL